MAAYLPIGGSRNATWAPTIELTYSGAALELTDAVVSLQWRLYEGQAGAALIDLPDLTFEDQADATTADPDQRVFRAFPSVSTGTLQALPGLNQPDAGDPQTFYYDLIVTYGDGLVERLAYGPIPLAAGVTV